MRTLCAGRLPRGSPEVEGRAGGVPEPGLGCGLEHPAGSPCTGPSQRTPGAHQEQSRSTRLDGQHRHQELAHTLAQTPPDGTGFRPPCVGNGRAPIRFGWGSRICGRPLLDNPPKSPGPRRESKRRPHPNLCGRRPVDAKRKHCLNMVVVATGPVSTRSPEPC